MKNAGPMLPYYVAAFVGALFVFVLSLLTDDLVTVMLAGLLAGVISGGIIAARQRRTGTSGRRRRR